MIGMASRRLKAAGIVVAAIAAAVTFCLPAPRAAVATSAVRLSSAAIAQIRAPHAPFPAITSALPTQQPAAITGVAAATAVLSVLLVIGAIPPSRRPAPVRVSRLIRRDRAPPSPRC